MTQSNPYSRGEFQPGLYTASFDFLTEAGMPTDLAREASQIVASDDSCQENLGRTPEQQSIISSVVTWLDKQRTNEK
jgi:hypothetical protein